MVNLKHFRDGDRLVLVIEGSTLSEEDILKSYLGTIGVTAASDASAAPIPAREEEMPQPDIRFKDGPYEGMTPEEAYETSRSKTAVIRHFLSQFGVFNSEELNREIQRIVRKHVKQFSGSPEQYANNLSPEQIQRFISLYGSIIPENLKKDCFNDYGTPAQVIEFASEEMQRDTIKKIVQYFENL